MCSNTKIGHFVSEEVVQLSRRFGHNFPKPRLRHFLLDHLGNKKNVDVNQVERKIRILEKSGGHNIRIRICYIIPKTPEIVQIRIVLATSDEELVATKSRSYTVRGQEFASFIWPAITKRDDSLVPQRCGAEQRLFNEFKQKDDTHIM